MNGFRFQQLLLNNQSTRIPSLAVAPAILAQRTRNKTNNTSRRNVRPYQKQGHFSSNDRELWPVMILTSKLDIDRFKINLSKVHLVQKSYCPDSQTYRNQTDCSIWPLSNLNTSVCLASNPAGNHQSVKLRKWHIWKGRQHCIRIHQETK